MTDTLTAEKNLIKKIVLDIEDKEIELTPEQAQKLYMALMALLSVAKEKEYVFYPLQPYIFYPSYPTYAPLQTLPCYEWKGNSAGSASCSADGSTAKITL